MIDYRRAIALQKKLAETVLTNIDRFPRIDFNTIRYVAGLDAGYTGGYAVGVAALIDYKSKQLITYSVSRKIPPIPYIPGLLAFREAPVYMSAINKLPIEPDIIIVDGHGLTHPRAFGIATHIGLVLDKPVIGVAKKKLFGEICIENGVKYVYAHGVKAGVLLTHRGKELYVSIGYKIRLEDAVKVVEEMLDPRYKLPIPTAIADQITKRMTRKKRR